MFHRRTALEDTPQWRDFVARTAAMQDIIVTAAFELDDTEEGRARRQQFIAEAERLKADLRCMEWLLRWSTILGTAVIVVGGLASLFFPRPWDTVVWIGTALTGCTAAGLFLAWRWDKK